VKSSTATLGNTACRWSCQACIFENQGTDWSQVARLTGPDGGNTESDASVSIFDGVAVRRFGQFSYVSEYTNLGCEVSARLPHQSNLIFDTDGETVVVGSRHFGDGGAAFVYTPESGTFLLALVGGLFLLFVRGARVNAMIQQNSFAPTPFTFTSIFICALLLAAGTARAEQVSLLFAFGTQGTGNGQFERPPDVAVDDSGNI